ncbi:ABC transporter permease [Fimbriimonas ginsengisoli]|uniref:Uncharacterized protein n=1 Tax=Fimbriimonas ginsengisoli Gsoil 348 TaxID=661478 RepID=A0A068NQ48_FIMGI|nr:ABC transporter permease subunit [Fimbriimonas ginsengisoli]AIE85678.1 hypothetical protein OP10G_2310 [Fimbriimonas ginsengisoli Gsoil 348]
MASPIADLSYRNYDGPMLPPVNRWWAIAKMSIRLALKKKGFWIWSVMSAYWYLILIAILYFVDNLSNGPLGQKNPFLSSMVWKDQFLNAFSISQMLLFIVALLIGVGTIANDNRANALLVYLSKPCSKLDYLIGKWFGIFLLITAVTAAPTLLFYLYGVLSYRQYGFLSEDPMLIFKLLAMSTIPGIVHASLAIGISAMFSQGRLAGATYAGLYFMTLFFTKAMQVTSSVNQFNHHSVPPIVNNLYYCSVDGIQIGLAKLVLGTDGSSILPMQAGGGGGRGRNFNPMPIPMPHATFILPLALALCAGALWIAWYRVRAVEVVG